MWEHRCTRKWRGTMAHLPLIFMPLQVPAYAVGPVNQNVWFHAVCLFLFFLSRRLLSFFFLSRRAPFVASSTKTSHRVGGGGQGGMASWPKSKRGFPLGPPLPWIRAEPRFEGILRRRHPHQRGWVSPPTLPPVFPRFKPGESGTVWYTAPLTT